MASFRIRVKYGKLLASLGLDGIGMITMLPLVWLDIAWAPISGIACFLLYGRTKFALLGGIVNTTEELLEFTDVIPTLTAMWAYKYGVKGKESLEEHLKKVKEQHDSIDKFLK